MIKEPIAGHTINMTFWLGPQNLSTILNYTTGIINRLRDEGPTADVLEKVKVILQEHTKVDLGYYRLGPYIIFTRLFLICGGLTSTNLIT